MISLKSHEKESLKDQFTRLHSLKYYIYMIIKMNRNSLALLLNRIFSIIIKSIFPLTAVKGWL